MRVTTQMEDPLIKRGEGDAESAAISRTSSRSGLNMHNGSIKKQNSLLKLVKAQEPLPPSSLQSLGVKGPPSKPGDQSESQRSRSRYFSFVKEKLSRPIDFQSTVMSKAGSSHLNAKALDATVSGRAMLEVHLSSE